MHKVSFVAAVAMSAALLVPVGTVSAGTGAPSVTITVAPFVKKTTVNIQLPHDGGSTTIVGYYVSESGATPALGAPGWKQAKPATFTLSPDEGNKTIFAWVKGANGVISARSHADTLLDQTAPTVSMDPPASTTTRTVSVDVTGSDAIGGPDSPAGITAWAVVSGTTAPGSNDLAWKPSAPATFKLPAGNGVKTISAFARDAAGNVSDPDSHDVTLAVPSPTVGITMPAFTNKLTTAVSLTRTDPGTTGIAGFCVSMVGTTPLANAACWKPQPTSIVLTAGPDGPRTVYAWVKDNNGTISARGQTTTTLDTIAPTVDLVAPGTTTSRNVSITVTGSDESSGVARYAVVAGTTQPVAADTAWKTVPVTSFQLSLGNGSKTISAFSRDVAGNVSLISSQTIVMTLAAPTVTVSMAAFTNKIPTPLTINATDPGGSGINSFFVSNSSTVPSAGAVGWANKPSTFTLTAGQGSRTVFVWVKDNNGTVSVGASASTFVDTVAPTASLAPLGSGGSSATKIITVSLGGSDATGVTMYAVVAGTATPDLANAAWKAVAPTTFTLSTGNGLKTVSAFTRDAAGNISAAATRTVTLAIPAPTVGITMPAYTKTTTTSLSLTRTVDATLGVLGFCVSEDSTTPLVNSSCWKIQPTSIVLAAGDGIHTVYAWVKDSNNTISAPSSTTTRLDTVKPIVTVFTVPGADADGNFAVTLSGSDTSGSGIVKWAIVVGPSPVAPSNPSDSAWHALPTPSSLNVGSTPGSVTVTAYLLDNAGNVSNGVSHVVVVGP